MDVRKNLVLIDDDQSIHAIIENHLLDSGWRLTSFSEEEQALDFLASFSPDILIIDIRMPKIDGDQILAELANDNKLGTTKIVVSSSVRPPASIWSDFLPFNADFIIKDDLYNRETFLPILSTE